MPLKQDNYEFNVPSDGLIKMLNGQWKSLRLSIQAMRDVYYDRSFGQGHELVIEEMKNIPTLKSGEVFNLTISIDQLDRKAKKSLQILNETLTKLNVAPYQVALGKLLESHQIAQREFSKVERLHRSYMTFLIKFYIKLEPEFVKVEQTVKDILAAHNNVIQLHDTFNGILNELFHDIDLQADPNDSVDDQISSVIVEDEFDNLVEPCIEMFKNTNNDKCRLIFEIIEGIYYVCSSIEPVARSMRLKLERSNEFKSFGKFGYQIDGEPEINVPPTIIAQKVTEKNQFIIETVTNAHQFMYSFAFIDLKKMIKRLKAVKAGKRLNNVTAKAEPILIDIMNKIKVIKTNFDQARAKFTIENLKKGLKTFKETVASAKAKSPINLHKQINSIVRKIIQDEITPEFNKLDQSLSEVRNSLDITATAQNKLLRIFKILFKKMQKSDAENQRILLKKPRNRQTNQLKWPKEFKAETFTNVMRDKLKFYSTIDPMNLFLNAVKRCFDEDFKILKMLENVVVEIKENKRLEPLKQFTSVDQFQYPDDDSLVIMNENRNKLLDAFEYLVEIFRSICFNGYFLELQKILEKVNNHYNPDVEPATARNVIQMLFERNKSRETIQEIIIILIDKKCHDDKINMANVELHYSFYRKKIVAFEIDRHTIKQDITDLESKMEVMNRDYDALIEQIEMFSQIILAYRQPIEDCLMKVIKDLSWMKSKKENAMASSKLTTKESSNKFTTKRKPIQRTILRRNMESEPTIDQILDPTTDRVDLKNAADHQRF